MCDNYLSLKDTYAQNENSLPFYIVDLEKHVNKDYVLENEVGPSHDKTFTISVYFENVKLGEGVGKTHKEAEQLAAKQALDKLAK